MKIEKIIHIVVLGMAFFSFGITIPLSESYAEESQVIIPDGVGRPGCEDSNSCYLPYAISVGVGQTITWTNDDTYAHTVTSGVSGYFGESEPLGPDGEFDSQLFLAGATFSHTFDREGAFPYFCIVHPWMKGIVLVDENYNSGPKFVDIQLFTDKESYLDGDTMKVWGTVSEKLDNAEMSLSVTRPGGDTIDIRQFDVRSDKTFQAQITTGGPLYDVDGIYSVEVRYGSGNMDLVAFEFRNIIQDLVPPLLLVPSDIIANTADPQGTRVDYSVKAIDDVDGVLQSFCNIESGRMFPIGDTTVICQALDNAGNGVEKSFTVTIQLDSQSITIPNWVKEVAVFWCSDNIDDASFIEAIQYLIENNVIIVPLNSDSSIGADQNIPSWIKNNACWWSQGLISDKDFASGIEYLIKNGIIIV